MDQIIQYIILILILLVLELIQIIWAKSKIKKWTLPILTFLFSLYMMAFFISFEMSDTLGPIENIWNVVSLSTLMMFLFLNIPRIMFIITNLIIKIKTKKNFIEN